MIGNLTVISSWASMALRFDRNQLYHEIRGSGEPLLLFPRLFRLESGLEDDTG